MDSKFLSPFFSLLYSPLSSDNTERKGNPQRVGYQVLALSHGTPFGSCQRGFVQWLNARTLYVPVEPLLCWNYPSSIHPLLYHLLCTACCDSMITTYLGHIQVRYLWWGTLLTGALSAIWWLNFKPCWLPKQQLILWK
jgi:hypothetical protein